MERAFLVVADQGGANSSLSSELYSADLTEYLPFDSRRQLHWSSPSRGIAAVQFLSESYSGSSPGFWAEKDGAVAGVVGTLRPNGCAWVSPEHWAEIVLDHARLREVRPQYFNGPYALFVIRPDGSGVACADPLGYRHLYHGSKGTRFAVGTRAGLVAAALSGSSPARDPLAVAHLAHNGLLKQGFSTYSGVELIEPGSWVEFPRSPDALPSVRKRTRTAPWSVRADSDLGVAERLDIIETELRMAVEGLACLSDETNVDLTGGKDSRLVLSLCATQPALTRATYRTYGADGLPDVEVARDVAAQAGVDWTFGLFLDALPEPSPYEDKFERFLGLTEGSVNVSNLALPIDNKSASTRVSGLNGECLRTHRNPARPLTNDDDLLAFRRKGGLRSGHLGLAKPDFRELFESELDNAIMDDPFGLSDPYDKLESFDIRTRGRGRYGQLESLSGLSGDFRVLPLYSNQAIEQAFLLGSELRRAETVPYELVRRLMPGLERIRFASEGWAIEPPGGYTRQPTATSTSNLTFMQSGSQSEEAERTAYLETLFQNASGDITEILDMRAAIDAAQRFVRLKFKEKVELLGAATAVAWCR